MRNTAVGGLEQCLEYRQTVEARTPRLVHGTALILCLGVVVALVWSWQTEVNLVVKASGRIRPVQPPTRVMAASSDSAGVTMGTRVVEVRCREGDVVRKGDLMLCLETDRLNNEIARRERGIQATGDELLKLDVTAELLASQGELLRAKAQAEVAQAEEEIRQNKERAASELRLAKGGLTEALEEESRTRRLLAQTAATREELARAQSKLRDAKERLERAQLPVDESRIAIAKRNVELTAKDVAVRREELQSKQTLKKAEMDAARLDLKNLALERSQASIYAPSDGIVTQGEHKPGDIVERGKPLFEIADSAAMHFEVLVPSEDAGGLSVGMPVRIKIDAFDFQKYGTAGGEVTALSPDAGLVDVGGGRRKAVYLVKVRLDASEIGRGEDRGQIKLGMTGHAEIVTDRESLLLVFLKKIRKTISFS